MLIAFEGPDNAGKSTSAKALSSEGVAVYNATKANHAILSADSQREPDSVFTFDRIDWLSHMVYRLALPDREWNDPRPRTVFAMPDTHLVVFLHRPDLADFTADELVNTPIGVVNSTYFYFADFFTGLNEQRDFALFKTLSIVEVSHDQVAGTYSRKLASFSSPTTTWSWAEQVYGNIDFTNEQLIALLRHEEQHRL